MPQDKPKWRSTTILSVRRGNDVALGGDGQVTLGDTIMKADTKKIRWMLDNKVLVGFAGSTADAFALMERFEAKAKDFPGNIPRAATELARDWRTDRDSAAVGSVDGSGQRRAQLVGDGTGGRDSTERRDHRHRFRADRTRRPRRGH